MSKTRIWATIIVATLLGITMVGVKHIDQLNDGIELKKIELKDNSLKLRLLDEKYNELNTELNKKDADKAKVEEQLKQLQIERDKLQADLQAKKEQKAKDLAVKAQQAAQATYKPQVAYASNCDSAKACIYQKESGNVPCKINGGAIDCGYTGSLACGIGQAWPCSKLRAVCSLSDYSCQDAFFTNYAVQRYGSWEKAWSFWQSNRYW